MTTKIETGKWEDSKNKSKEGKMRKLITLTKFRLFQWYVDFAYYDKNDKYSGRHEQGYISEEELYQALKKANLLEEGAK